MKVKQDKPEDGKVKLTISADAQEVDAAITYLLIKCASENSVDTSESPDLEFAVRAKVGNEFWQAYLDYQLPLFLAAKAVGVSKIESILNPEIVGKLPRVEKSRSLQFQASVILKPQLTLTSYEPVTVTVAPITISESELDDQLYMLAESFATYTDDEEGNPDPTTKTIPAITDSWVEENIPNAVTVTELREMIRLSALAYKQNEQHDYIAYTAASELAKRLQGNISTQIFELTGKDLLASLQRNLDYQQRTMQEFVASQGGEAAFQAHMLLQTREVLRQGFALDALARHLELQVSAADLDEAFRRMAPGHEDMAYLDFEQTGRMYVMEEAALRMKANNWLVETAIVNYRENDESPDSEGEDHLDDDQASVDDDL